MEELIDLIATDSSASSISDKIKDILYAKAAERIDLSRPLVATSLFGLAPIGAPVGEITYLFLRKKNKVVPNIIAMPAIK